jgi:hypothetical protein
MSELNDRQLICGDCGKEYVWSGVEQTFFIAKEFPPPKRCKECRQARKEQRAEATSEWERKSSDGGSG